MTDAEPGGMVHVSSFFIWVPYLLIIEPSRTSIMPDMKWKATYSFGPALTIYHLVCSPGLTLNSWKSLFSGILAAVPTDGTYLCDMPFVSVRSGLSLHSLTRSNEPTVPLVPTK